jgi:hypothetical protein
MKMMLLWRDPVAATPSGFPPWLEFLAERRCPGVFAVRDKRSHRVMFVGVSGMFHLHEMIMRVLRPAEFEYLYSLPCFDPYLVDIAVICTAPLEDPSKLQRSILRRYGAVYNFVDGRTRMSRVAA